MNAAVNELVLFAERYTNKVVEADTDLYLILRKRFDPFIKDYAREFNVDISNYKQYFHTSKVNSELPFSIFYTKPFYS
jgi:hypothetical protein